ncbi:MAG: RelA/SpoT domain-containing protein [Paracoccaceae bacterium]|uniref:RelA/SpoT domain-containing protein n=1 Tax=Shimia thalassica TaxID=1715693 RepID=UPI003297F638
MPQNRLHSQIANPKDSGYRSVHLMLRFNGGGIGEKHKGCNVELQLRTQLQHIWGTAVEAVGSMRNEDLKAGDGDPQWLRFLALMSGYIAEIEKQPRGLNLGMSYDDLVLEAKELATSLNVRENLSSFRGFMHEADSSGSFGSSVFTLKVDRSTGAVQIAPRWRALFAFDDLEDDFEEVRQSIEISIDSMTELRRAYPNYYLDTEEFLNVLGEMEGSKPTNIKGTIDRLDLSFLPKHVPPRAGATKEKPDERALRLDIDGTVYWHNKKVGTWDRNLVGVYFFIPRHRDEYAFSQPSFSVFTSELEQWCATE